MHILLIGCGRAGRHLAEILVGAGLELIVVDESESNLASLEGLNVVTVKGVPIDTEILEEAGIKDAAAVIATDDKENINLMCCQIAAKLYQVPHVVARTYTPENEDFVHSLGISTICSTELTVGRALQALGFEEDK